MTFFDLIFFAASQQPIEAAVKTTQNVDHPDWQYWVAIASMSSVVVTLFGLLMRSASSRATEIKALNKEHNEAMDAKAKRVADEFERKDKAILEVSTEFARLMERVASELRNLNDKG